MGMFTHGATCISCGRLWPCSFLRAAPLYGTNAHTASQHGDVFTIPLFQWHLNGGGRGVA